MALFRKSRRTFEDTGTVDPDGSYHVELENVANIKDQDLKTMVDIGRYFSIFAPRQSGKTTYLENFCEKLESDPMYVAISLSFDKYGNLDKLEFYRLIRKALYSRLIARLDAVKCPNLDGVKKFLDSHDLVDHISFGALFEELNQRIKHKKIVLFIDEFDGAPKNELEDFLITIRALYQQYKKRKDKALYSVGLVGVRNITKLVVGGVSPFNIADQVSLPPFTPKNISDLYSQYTEETNQPFEETAVKRVFEETAGQPWLVNRLGSILTINVKPKTTDPITADDVDDAIERLLMEDNNHFDNLQEKIKTCKTEFERIALGEVEFDHLDDEHSFLRQYGVIGIEKRKAVIANNIYKKRFIGHFQKKRDKIFGDAGRSHGPDPEIAEKKNIFISYSHMDEQWKNHLMSHLSIFKQEKLLDIWEDRRIKPGEDWAWEIRKALSRAGVAVLLISANFLDSNFIQREEVPALLEKRRKEGLVVIPVIVKPCAWRATPWLSSMQVIPKDGAPLMKGTEYEIEEKLAQIAEQIASVI